MLFWLSLSQLHFASPISFKFLLLFKTLCLSFCCTAYSVCGLPALVMLYVVLSMPVLHTLSFPLSQVSPQILSSVFYFSLTAAGDLGDFPPHIPCSVAFHFILPLAQKVLPPAQPFEQPRTGSRHRGRLICLGNCCQLSCSTAADPHVAPLSSVFN